MTSKYDGMVEVVASPIIVNTKGEILLIKSHKWGDKYLIPGGHAEAGERICATAQREGEEETGLRLEPQYCVNIGENIYDPDFHRKAHLVYFHVVCKALAEDVRLDGTELQEFIWIDPHEALKLELVKGIRESIENYINGIRIPITS
ncbi:MAG: NUDIX domain-containing protein [Candidatus Paceibacterota bacterium]